MTDFPADIQRDIDAVHRALSSGEPNVEGTLTERSCDTYRGTTDFDLKGGPMRPAFVSVFCGCALLVTLTRPGGQDGLLDARALDETPASAQSFGAWGMPKPLSGLLDQVALDKHAPVVSPDDRSLYFSVVSAIVPPATQPDADIWVSRRASINFDWLSAVRLETTKGAGSVWRIGKDIHTDLQEGPPTLSADGLEMYFSRTGTCGGRDIWVASRRTMATEKWGPSVQLKCDAVPGGVNSSIDDVDPMVFQKTLYFARGNGSGPYRIYETRPAIRRVSGPGAVIAGLPPKESANVRVAGLPLKDRKVKAAGPPEFDQPSLVEELRPLDANGVPDNTKTDRRPFLRHDGLEIVFASNRIEPNEPARMNVWTSMRPTIKARWSKPMPISIVNSPDFDGGPSLSSDATTLYFYRIMGTTPPGPGQIWVSTRVRLN